MENQKLRIAELDDAEQMLAIYAPYVKNTRVSAEYEVPTCEVFQERIRETEKQFPWIVCEIDGEIVGYGYASRHHARAAYQWSVETSIYVKNTFHRQGIASTIYKALFEILAWQGFYNIFVGITSPNEKSFQFHSAMGFVDSGSYQNTMYKFGKWCDVHWMAKSLREHMGEPKPTISFPEIRESERLRTIFMQCK